MRLFFLAALFGLLAALIIELPKQEQERLVVFESQDCETCKNLREYIVRPYLLSKAGEQLPMEVVDVPSLGTSGHALAAPIKTLPTVIVTRGGREIARLVGYHGPDRFYDFIAATLDLKRSGTMLLTE